jgi:5-methylcytosine-specific restriction enzyme subunit McrC
MRTDVLLSQGDERIVIDTKYTPRAVTEESGYYGGTLQSGHLYQMHAYLSTLAGEGAHPLRGILLYPRVGREVRATYRHADYDLEVRTVDLGAPWRQIHDELLSLTGLPEIATQGAAMTPTGPPGRGQRANTQA